jgi:hypothetical protein
MSGSRAPSGSVDIPMTSSGGQPMVDSAGNVMFTVESLTQILTEMRDVTKAVKALIPKSRSEVVVKLVAIVRQLNTITAQIDKL